MRLRYLGFQPSLYELSYLMNRLQMLEELFPSSVDEGEGEIGLTETGEYVATFEWAKPGGPLRVTQRRRHLEDLISDVVNDLKGWIRRARPGQIADAPPEPTLVPSPQIPLLH